MAAGVSAQVCDNNDRTALNYARSAEVVAVLLQAGCPLNADDKFDMTALDAALHDEQADVVRALVAAGMSLESRDTYGNTVLLKLCFSMEVSAVMVQLLIDLGADIGARTYHGRTALHQAAELWVGDRRGLLGDVIRVLVKAGIPVDIKDDDGCTPLHLAVGTEGTDISAVEAFLDLGADINAVTSEGLSPLMIAVDDGYYGMEVVPLLMSRGADIRQTTPDGLTARDYAVYRLRVWERIVADGLENAAAGDPASKERHLTALETAKSVLQIIDRTLADNAEK